MVKKRVKSSVSSAGNERVEKMLIENSVSLQRALVNLSVKLDNLAEKISKLLELFELSAKSFSEGKFSGDKGKDVSQKIDSLLEQNKTLAKGLALMYEKTPGFSASPSQQNQQAPETDFGGYQRSMQTGEINNAPYQNQKFKPLPKRE